MTTTTTSTLSPARVALYAVADLGFSGRNGATRREIVAARRQLAQEVADWEAGAPARRAAAPEIDLEGMFADAE